MDRAGKVTTQEEGSTKINPVRIFRWVWSDAVMRNFRKIQPVIVLQVLAVVCNFAGFGVLYFYVNAVDTEKVISILNYEFHPRASQILLLLTGITVGVLLLINAFSNFGFHKRLFKINREFEEFCVSRLIESVNETAGILHLQDNPKLSPYNIKKSLIKDSKFYSRALFSLVKATVPIAKLCFSLLFMFYLAFSFTLILIIPLAVGGYFIFKVSKSVIKETSRKEHFIKPFVQNISLTLASRLSGNSLLQEDASQQYYSAYYSWMLNVQKNRLVLNVLVAVISFSLLLVIGHMAIFGSTSWVLLVGYLVALRFFLNSLMGIQVIVKQLSSFYDYIRNYYTILSSLEQLKSLHPEYKDFPSEASNDYFAYHPDDDDGDDIMEDF